MKRWFGLMGLAGSLLAAGCGRPPSAGGPPGEFSVNAVVALVEGERLESSVQLVGSLRARDSVNVVTEINGVVAEVLFAEGDVVEAGQVLARLDDVKLAARRDEARARHRLAETTMRRSEELFRSQTISQQEVDQARAEYDVATASLNLIERELADTVVTARFTGVVGDRRVSPGQFAMAGTILTRLVQMDPLEIEFRVPERHLARVERGQRVVLETAAFPGHPVEGEVVFIAPEVDETTRTVLVKALASNSGLRFRPGLFGTLELVLAVREDAMLIPEQAIRYSGDQASVVVMNEEDRAEFRPVVVGQRVRGRAEIVEGLRAGERVVIEGFQKMGPGTAILISPESERHGVTPPEPEA
ncbi:MAG TPA: efflux RND transporter periplasmic adaptor subunit [Kiritimatiellia bacterium]|nr:efflux RND transporter periplasmic adaptor subunit [Kiritimatiellia bacterium]